MPLFLPGGFDRPAQGRAVMRKATESRPCISQCGRFVFVRRPAVPD